MEKCYNQKIHPECHYIRVQVTDSCGSEIGARIPENREDINLKNKHCSAKPCQYGEEKQRVKLMIRLDGIDKLLRDHQRKNQPTEEKKAKALAELILIAQKMHPEPEQQRDICKPL